MQYIQAYHDKETLKKLNDKVKEYKQKLPVVRSTVSTVLLAQHPRCGALSPLSLLPKEILLRNLSKQ